MNSVHTIGLDLERLRSYVHRGAIYLNNEKDSRRVRFKDHFVYKIVPELQSSPSVLRSRVKNGHIVPFLDENHQSMKQFSTMVFRSFLDCEGCTREEFVRSMHPTREMSDFEAGEDWSNRSDWLVFELFPEVNQFFEENCRIGLVFEARE